MATHLVRSHPGRPRPLADPGHQAFVLLRTVFTIAPIAFGLDKFAVALARLAVRYAPVRAGRTEPNA